MQDFYMPDSWYDPPEDQYDYFDPNCPDCGEDALTVEGYAVSCMECDYTNDLEQDDYEGPDEDYYYDFDSDEDWNDD